MRRLRIAVTVLVLALMVFSVSVFASDQTTTRPPALHLASANQPSEETAANSGGHETDSHDTAHAESGPGHGQGHPNLGPGLPLWSCIPFACMLLSIALWPLLMPDFWHHHFGKISAFWAATLAIPFLIVFKGDALYEILHIILADYVPFIILLWSLYTVSGGILLRGTLRGTPMVNVVILIIGTVLASWMGTTGAAMLLIRPFLRANDYRKNRTFMVVFFIFLVANAGGSLTPLGDPPLFLGFLHGVSFFWTLKILPHMATVAVILLVIYFFLDTYHYRKEGVTAPADDGEKQPLKLEGVHNFIFLAGIVGSVLMSGMVDWGEFNTLGVHRAVQDWVRDGLLIIMGTLSLVTTSVSLREDNNFTWFPIIEVAYLFIGIFIAPTYLTFFNTALGSFYAGMPEAASVPLLMTENAVYLQAISAGAVFFGACSYIGNAPNFMVRSISEEAGTPMPSFFGYILKYSLIYLIPTFVVVTLVFF
jgi:Na+/H+ antiporter NhaD/arsenite permease-like protein